MKRTVWMLGLLLLAAALVPGRRELRASPELGESMQLACTVCHDKPGSKLLTDRGKYYETVGTLEGYEEIVEGFQGCTSCHVRKPGSKKLTTLGRRVSYVVRDMEDLKVWFSSGHPAEPETQEDAEKAGGEEEQKGEEGG